MNTGVINPIDWSFFSMKTEVINAMNVEFFLDLNWSYKCRSIWSLLSITFKNAFWYKQT